MLFCIFCDRGNKWKAGNTRPGDSTFTGLSLDHQLPFQTVLLIVATVLHTFYDDDSAQNGRSLRSFSFSLT